MAARAGTLQQACPPWTSRLCKMKPSTGVTSRSGAGGPEGITAARQQLGVFYASKEAGRKLATSDDDYGLTDDAGTLVAGCFTSLIQCTGGAGLEAGGTTLMSSLHRGMLIHGRAPSNFFLRVRERVLHFYRGPIELTEPDTKNVCVCG